MPVLFAQWDPLATKPPVAINSGVPAFLGPIVVSACLGALIGLIRQSSETHDQPSTDFGGVRTYMLWALLGCVGAHLSEKYVVVVLPVVLFLVAAQFVVVHLADALGGKIGSTTFGAALLTCLVGALVNWGETQAAVLVAALTMVVLGSKRALHTWTQAFTQEDIRATLQFAAITGVILPLVPDRAMGPLGAFNPYSTWLMVVLISGVGFVGYLLMRFLGAQAGITLTGLVGGLASSTATTLALSRRSREDAGMSANYALAVNLACSVMPLRVLAMIWFLSDSLMRVVALPLLLMAAPGVAYAVGSRFANQPGNGSMDTPGIRNPLSLATALKFAALYAAFAFLIKAVTAQHWNQGVLPLSFLSGLTDMDAITLLMANSATDGSVLLSLAAKAVVIGAIANSLMKAALAISLGSRDFRGRVAAVLAVSIAAGAASGWFI